MTAVTREIQSSVIIRAGTALWDVPVFFFFFFFYYLWHETETGEIRR